MKSTPGGTAGSPVDPDYPGHSALGAAKNVRMAQIPPKMRSLFLEAQKGTSRKASIKAFCLECMGFDRDEVRRCLDRWCPLYPWRENG